MDDEEVPALTRARAKAAAGAHHYKGRTIADSRQLRRDELRFAVLAPYPEDVERPRTRGDCLPGGINEARPCPFVSCKHHLYLDVDPNTGGLKLNHPHLEVDELQETCALDVADRDGGITLEETGHLINVTRERVRQIEERAARKGARTILGKFR